MKVLVLFCGILVTVLADHLPPGHRYQGGKWKPVFRDGHDGPQKRFGARRQPPFEYKPKKVYPKGYFRRKPDTFKYKENKIGPMKPPFEYKPKKGYPQGHLRPIKLSPKPDSFKYKEQEVGPMKPPFEYKPKKGYPQGHLRPIKLSPKPDKVEYKDKENVPPKVYGKPIKVRMEPYKNKVKPPKYDKAKKMKKNLVDNGYKAKKPAPQKYAGPESGGDYAFPNKKLGPEAPTKPKPKKVPKTPAYSSPQQSKKSYKVVDHKPKGKHYGGGAPHSCGMMGHKAPQTKVTNVFITFLLPKKFSYGLPSKMPMLPGFGSMFTKFGVDQSFTYESGFPKYKPRSGYKPQPEYEPQSGYKPQPEYEPQSGYKPQPEYEPQSGYKPQPEYELQSGYKPQPEYEPESGYKPQPEYEPQSGYKPQAEYEPQFGYQPQAEYEPQSVYKPRLAYRRQVDNKPEFVGYLPQLFNPSVSAFDIEEPHYDPRMAMRSFKIPHFGQMRRVKPQLMLPQNVQY